eukprot:scaffold24333_cov132-Cylindrotheca_fusiformis.AAC.1
MSSCLTVNSMEPLKKKPRKNSYDSPQPDASVSAPPATTTTPAAAAATATATATATAPSVAASTSNYTASEKDRDSEDIVRSLLRDLRTSTTSQSAYAAIQNLYDKLILPNQKVDLVVAKAITQWNGCGVILMALKDWHAESHEFCCRAIRCLVLITAQIPIAKQYVVELGGVRTVLQANNNDNDDNKKSDSKEPNKQDYFLRSNSVGLIHNLSVGVANVIRDEVASEECLDFVCRTMNDWPYDRYTQKRGIKYLMTIGRMEDAQATLTLQKKRVGVLFVNALDRFRNTNEEVKTLAQEALQWYAMS